MRKILSILTLLSVFFVLTNAVVAAPAPTRPNILFIMTDDHAAHAISAYGSVVNKTPNIDRLAQEGMRFDSCFAMNSICTPSRATILTGKYSHLNGAPVFNRFDGSQPTVAKYLQAARLSHRHDRQMASGQRSHRLRPMDRSSGPGRLLRSRVSHARGTQGDHRATRRTSSPTSPSTF